MKPPILGHDLEVSFADEFDLPDLDVDSYGISADVGTEIYDGMEDAGIWGADGDDVAGGASGANVSWYELPNPSAYSFNGTSFPGTAASGISIALTPGTWIVRMAIESLDDLTGGTFVRLNCTSPVASYFSFVSGTILTKGMDLNNAFEVYSYPGSITTLPSFNVGYAWIASRTIGISTFTTSNSYFTADLVVTVTANVNLWVEAAQANATSGNSKIWGTLWACQV